jgi:UDP-2,3-diacylglucosamine pyrophosphatase LpxH
LREIPQGYLCRLIMKRHVDIVVISDVHLGTHGCQARQLNNYLKSVQPRTLILNGDIFDIWYFKKSYFPKEHMDVVRRILKMAANDTKVYYLTGNHDDMLRKFGEMSFGLVHLRNKLVFQVNGRTHWVFHGDVFDASIHKARWLARLGGEGYDLLIRFNRLVNRMRGWVGFPPVSFAAKVKKGVKGAVKRISDFEETAIRIASEKNYDCVICGHIHRPQIREIVAENGKNVRYLNSGDWVENLTALEFQNEKWTLYKYDESDYEVVNARLRVLEKEPKGNMPKQEEFVPEMNGVAAIFETV